MSKPIELEKKAKLLDNKEKQKDNDTKSQKNEEANFKIMTKRLSKEFAQMRQKRTPSRIREFTRGISTEKHSIASERSEDEFGDLHT